MLLAPPIELSQAVATSGIYRVLGKTRSADCLYGIWLPLNRSVRLSSAYFEALLSWSGSRKVMKPWLVQTNALGSARRWSGASALRRYAPVHHNSVRQVLALMRFGDQRGGWSAPTHNEATIAFLQSSRPQHE